MRVYRGKFSLEEYAEDEPITVILPTTFDAGEPVCAYWQWTKDYDGNPKVNNMEIGVIELLELDKRRIGFFLNKYYRFEATLSERNDSMELSMFHDTKRLALTTLKLSFSYESNAFQSRDYLVYVGDLDWMEYAKREMLLIIIPRSLSLGVQVSAYWMWTEDGSGNPNMDNDVKGPLETSTGTEEGTSVAFFGDKYYRFSGNISKSKETMDLVMTNRNEASRTINLRLHYPNLSSRKALIARYNTGTDQGIFDVKALLTESLGFESTYIDMLYFDSEPPGQNGLLTHGQGAPTATRFKQMFNALIAGTGPGDVRFVYVDAHGVRSPKDDPGEPGNYDEAWKLAERDDGRTAATVTDNWIAETIERDLHQLANLTIVCTSCLGGGLLDTHRTTKGILMSACAETQINVKAINRKDPWTVAIIKAIKKRRRARTPIPTYYDLFTEARLVIRTLMDQGLTPSYRGPSPDPRNPIPWEEGGPMRGHQDPQLVFHGTYIQVARAAFLEPFAPLIEINEGRPTRYPRDEL